MSINWTVITAIAGPVLGVLLTTWFNRWRDGRPKLVVFCGHHSEFNVKVEGADQTPFVVRTHSIVVRNSGRQSAKNVRIGHNILPPNFKIEPVISYSVEDLSNGGKEIKIPNLVPGRQITISYLYHPPLELLHINVHVESDEGAAKVINVLPTPQMPKWVAWIISILNILGFVTFVYLIYLAINSISRIL